MINLQKDLIIKIKAALEKNKEIPHIPSDILELLEDIIIACEQGNELPREELMRYVEILLATLSLLYQINNHT